MTTERVKISGDYLVSYSIAARRWVSLTGMPGGSRTLVGGSEMALEVSQLLSHVYHQRPLTTVPEHNVTALHAKEEEHEEQEE